MHSCGPPVIGAPVQPLATGLAGSAHTDSQRSRKTHEATGPLVFVLGGGHARDKVTVERADKALNKVFQFAAYKTATDGIVVHPALGGAGNWTITVESCGIRLGSAKTRDGAFLIAGAYPGLPIAWDRIPTIHSKKEAAKVVEILSKRLEKCPSVMEGLGVIQQDGAM